MFDYFEEADCQEKQQKKEKIQKLKIREPVKQTTWTPDSTIDEYYI
jgi:hypothetical protein